MGIMVGWRDRGASAVGGNHGTRRPGGRVRGRGHWIPRRGIPRGRRRESVPILEQLLNRLRLVTQGEAELKTGQAPAPVIERGRVPRVAKLLALAIKFERLVKEGTVQDYAELARLGRVSRARLTQIANLTLLAPDIQEEILFLPRIDRGKDVLSLRQLQPIALQADWRKQRKMWEALKKATT